jgi:hypothetical protein
MVSTSQAWDGPNLLGYNSIYLFKPNSNGTSFATSQITVNTNNGSVIYTPDISVPANKVLWMTNRTGLVLRQLCFKVGQNMDSSQNNALVTATLLMDDNGMSGQTTNNIASILRSFMVQMRCD